MTPKEKAKELVNKFLQIYDGRVPQAKRCALICADEILELQLELSHDDDCHNISNFYKEVKEEINNL
tara:strand:+ start:620 stop:820 length:201 start_codon:yes stop_codon:yes gene_type:complete